MPFLDVTDVLNDPDFSQKVVITRTIQTVDNYGETVQSLTTHQTSAVVTPITAQELLRLPDAERLQGGCSVYTKFPLLAGKGNLTADIVTVNDSQYVVISIDDWGAFGKGYVVAKCALLDMRDKGVVL